MTEREFCYWLQGVLEIGNEETFDERQVQIIRAHLALVFTKVTPDFLREEIRTVTTAQWPPDKPLSFEQTYPGEALKTFTLC